jgi:hypothetical protein
MSRSHSAGVGALMQLWSSGLRLVSDAIPQSPEDIYTGLRRAWRGLGRFDTDQKGHVLYDHYFGSLSSRLGSENHILSFDEASFMERCPSLSPPKICPPAEVSERHARILNPRHHRSGVETAKLWLGQYWCQYPSAASLQNRPKVCSFA